MPNLIIKTFLLMLVTGIIMICISLYVSTTITGALAGIIGLLIFLESLIALAFLPILRMVQAKKLAILGKLLVYSWVFVGALVATGIPFFNLLVFRFLIGIVHGV